MGHALCKPLALAESERENQRRNVAISKEIMLEKERNLKTVKLLLLGAAESGKSTILKQMRILHTEGFSKAEILCQSEVIRHNLLSSMELILNAMIEFSISFEHKKNEENAQLVREFLLGWAESEALSKEVVRAVKGLWKDEGVQHTFAQRHSFQLHDSAKYFLDSIDRIAHPRFIPTDEDILYARSKTTGIVEIHFVHKTITFRVFDVGGQRSERKKWIHCFEGVDGVIFIASISEYDQVLSEDNFTNRLTEARLLFGVICNNRWFKTSAMILFLNKIDLFLEKIPRSSIKSAFPEYGGPQDSVACAQFISDKFDEMKINKEKRVYIHQTCATNTNQVQMVIDSTMDIIINQNLQSSGMQ